MIATQARNQPGIRRVLFVVPGGLGRVTGGNVYDAAVADAMRGRGWTVEVRDNPNASGRWDVAVVDSLAFRQGRPQTSVPYVPLAHQLPSAAAGYPEPTVQERDVLRFASLVVTASDWLRDHFRPYVGAEIVAVHPGRDRAWAADGPAPDADAILCIANAQPGKGVPETIDAFSRANLDEVRLLLVGDMAAHPEESVRVRDALASSRGRVETAGVVAAATLSGLYAEARALLIASRYEGRPIAVIEAMASGVPVVGFDVPGLRELVRPGRDGLLAGDGDVDDLASSLRDLVGDRILAAAMGRAARRRALEWPTWEETGGRFADLVAGLLEGQPNAAR